MTKQKDKFDIFWVGVSVNALILFVLMVCAINNVTESAIINMLEMFWYLTFGWIAGRLSV